MQELSRYLVLLFIGLFVLSFSLVQCRSIIDPQKRLLRNIDYINMCMFRKTRLCDYLREMGNARIDETKEDRQVWKRGISQFYSNW